MHIFIGLIIMVISIFNLLKPRVMWNITEGWKYRNGEPSDMRLGLIQASGALGLFVGFIVMLIP